jgi:hypothetical protein
MRTKLIKAISTGGWSLAREMALLVLFAFWQARAASPLLPPRVVPDRYRGGAYASMLIASAGLFGSFLFLTYYLQQMLGYSPVVTGFAFLSLAGLGMVIESSINTAPSASLRGTLASRRLPSWWASNSGPRSARLS